MAGHAFDAGRTCIRDVTQGRWDAVFDVVQCSLLDSPTAAKGGDIGWIQQGQLQDAMNAALMNLNAGQISQPVRSLTGYHIYFMRNKKVFAEGDIPSADQVLERLGLKRLERLQYQYFLDLKATSFVDIRL